MIKLYTFAHKRPDFLELQLQSFQKHLKCDFEFIVFNNAAIDTNNYSYKEIKFWCGKNDIKSIDIKKDQELINHLYVFDSEDVFDNKGYTNAVIACAYPICYAWKHHLSQLDNKICIIDSDMFLSSNINIESTLDEYDLVYMEQSRGSSAEIQYMWNGLVFMNLKSMSNKSSLNWWCGRCDGVPVDVGGQTHYYLKKYKDTLKIKTLTQHYVGEDPECDFSPANYEYFGLDGAKTFLHYRGGSNWDRKLPAYHGKKTQWLKSKLNAS